MSAPLRISFFGSSLVSSYWNGAATYYRGLIRSLHGRGHQVTFYEPDAYGRQQHRDMEDPEWARVVVYAGEGEAGVHSALADARGSDVVIKCGGVGVFDALLEAAVAEMRNERTQTAFLDVDTPATLERLAANPDDPFHGCIPKYDLVLTYSSGPSIDGYLRHGARRCEPLHNALDPTTHYPVPPEPRFEGDLGFLGNRLPDREARVEEFFLRAAAECPQRRFLLGGNGWGDKGLPGNVNYLGHVYTRDHNAFNCTPRAVLNISRESMAVYGYSPATRVFEAAGAGACLITDYFPGIDQFFEPDAEVLVAHNGNDVAAHVAELSPERARSIGQAALRRVLADHTYDQRAAWLESLLTGQEAAA